jgi:UDP-glucuronate 4-epimerase
MKILVTGSAGFIGSALSKSLLERGDEVVGVDNFDSYYDVKLKKARSALLEKNKNFKLQKADFGNLESIQRVFEKNKFDAVAHLGAQAGVRYSIDNPYAYSHSNLEGFINVINLTRDRGIENFVYASSSSVYGDRGKVPFSERASVNKPISLYAATKRANELMAYTYHHLYGIRTIGLRFFTVYGPWGRPDMAIFKFADMMAKGQEIPVYNYGKGLKRDYTYVDDIVDGVVRAIDSKYRNEIFNLGKGHPEDLGEMIRLLEKYMKIKAQKNLLPMQKGDVMITYADTSKARKMLGFKTKVSLDEGIKRFVQWYKQYYNV